MNPPFLQQTLQLIKQSNNILLITHKKIDGDGLSSIIALYLILRKLHKNVTAVCEEPVPEVYKFLPTTDIVHSSFSGMSDFIVSVDIKNTDIDHINYKIENGKINFFISPKKGNITLKDISVHKGTNKYDLIIILDTPEYDSLGNIYEKNIELFFKVPVINIDHHVNNTHFGKINLVDITASSTTEILFQLIHTLQGKELFDEDIATLLLAGIITDTGSFQNPNTTPQSFFIASQLVQLGARQQEIIRHIYKTKKLSTLKLWGQVLNNVKNDPIYRMVWSTLSYKEVIENNATEEDIISVIDNLLGNAPGAEIVILLAEWEKSTVKGYIKTVAPSIDAGKIAGLFKGTGSYNEGMFELDESLNKSYQECFSKIKEFQAKRLGIAHEKKQLPAVSQEEKKDDETKIKEEDNFPTISSEALENSIGESLEDQLGKE